MRTRSGKVYGVQGDSTAGRTFVQKASGKVKYTSKKRKAPVAVVSTAMIKAAVLNAAETKRFYASDNATALKDSLTVPYYKMNPLYWISFGNNDSSRIGDEITLMGIDINFTFFRDLNNNYAETCGTVWLVKSSLKEKDGIAGPASGSVFSGDLRLGNVGHPNNPIVDTNQYTVIAQKKWSMPAPSFNVTAITAAAVTTNSVWNGATAKVSMHVPLKGVKFIYDTANTGYGKFHNYYIVYTVDACASTAANVAGPICNYTVYFKDL